MNIVGAYGEGTRSEGDMYQISNNQTIGITEQDIISNLQVITQKIIDQERSTRKNLAKNEIDFEDKLLWARNKWLIAHPDSSEAKQGAFVGLSGINIDIAKAK